MKSNIINSLNSLSEMTGTCGKYGSLQCDGDGLISIYNILQLLKLDNVTIEDVNKVCIKRRAHWFGGMGWFKIRKIKRVLKDFNVRAKYKGVFKSYSQISDSHKFIIIYWRYGKYYQFKNRLKFLAACLVKDTTNTIWIETFNPYRHYNSINQFKRFEEAFMPLLFTIE